VSSPDQEVVSADRVREAMRGVPAAVTVVLVGGEEPQGITISSFTTASLEPPLISFNVGLKARVHDALRDSHRFAVHVLASVQEEVSAIFADSALSGSEQLRRVSHHTDAHGIPDIDGAMVRLECSRFAFYPAGDHSICLGRIEAVRWNDSARALIYMDRGYRSIP
jgi:flavin reductase (DIM6/NTAB) family NADH-FMN oxidoreductase RutF